MLSNLKNKYQGEDAIIIMGGHSIIQNNLDLSLLNKKNSIIFLEPKSLTPKLHSFNLKPDYLLSIYPEKLRTNTMQYTFMQAIACDYDLESSLKKKYAKEWNNFVDDFAELAEIRRIRFPHKKYKVKSEIILKNSPYDLLNKYPDLPMICFDQAYDLDGTKKLNLPNKQYLFSMSSEENTIDNYLNPSIVNGKLVIHPNESLNSATIAIIPLMHFFGFKRVTFIGKDMSMLGAMEYSAPYIFKSMRHYKSFYNASRLAFSYGFPRGFNRGFLSLFKNLFLIEANKINIINLLKKFKNDAFGLKGNFSRNKIQFKDYKNIIPRSNIEFLNVYTHTNYCRPVPGMKNIAFQDFIDKK